MMSPCFEIEDALFGGVRRLTLQGELDLGIADQAETAIHGALESSPSVKVDLRKLTFIDSSGLRVLLKACELSHDMGKVFTIIPGPPSIQRVFEVTGTAERLPFASEP